MNTARKYKKKSLTRFWLVEHGTFKMSIMFDLEPNRYQFNARLLSGRFTFECRDEAEEKKGKISITNLNVRSVERNRRSGRSRMFTENEVS